MLIWNAAKISTLSTISNMSIKCTSTVHYIRMISTISKPRNNSKWQLPTWLFRSTGAGLLLFIYGDLASDLSSQIFSAYIDPCLLLVVFCHAIRVRWQNTRTSAAEVPPTCQRPTTKSIHSWPRTFACKFLFYLAYLVYLAYFIFVLNTYLTYLIYCMYIYFSLLTLPRLLMILLLLAGWGLTRQTTRKCLSLAQTFITSFM